jgi:hypothetical protein
MRDSRLHVVIGVAVVLAFAGCSTDTPRTGGERSSEQPGHAIGAVEEIPSPAQAPAGEPHFARGGDGAVVLSWREGDRNRAAVRVAEWNGEEWSGHQTVVERDDLFVNFADFPSVLVTPGGTRFAHWLQRSGEGKYAYDVRLASSRGGGGWSDGVVPHRDGTQTEHGFVSLVPLEGGRAGILWLDGRETAGEHGGAMTLRYAETGGDGSVGGEELVDPLVCDCCQTSAVVAGGDVVVVYRDRSTEEIRDISIARRRNGVWSEPRPVARDGWEIPGCPVNGPQIDVAGEALGVAWYTEAGGEARVLAAFSSGAGEEFDAPIEVDRENPLGRVDLVMLDERTAAISWLSRAGDEADVMLQIVTRGGGRSDTVVLGRTSAGRASGFPRLVASGKAIFAAWTEPASGSIAVRRVGIETR